jgi:hypothetical protein
MATASFKRTTCTSSAAPTGSKPLMAAVPNSQLNRSSGVISLVNFSFLILVACFVILEAWPVQAWQSKLHTHPSSDDHGESCVEDLPPSMLADQSLRTWRAVTVMDLSSLTAGAGAVSQGRNRSGTSSPGSAMHSQQMNLAWLSSGHGVGG